jgi:3-methylcrotonyl-CoA carboxylase alpha subunit
MIKKLLIANRGEIACRIIKTAKRMNMTTVAVYSAIDKNALHVALADEAYLIGPAPAAQSYLDSKKIIDVAKQSAADAIHPGYGFLAEDAEFAALCEKNKIIFVGPSAAAIAAMGDKRNAKHLMEKADIPIVPGYSDAKQDVDTLKTQIKKIGLPVLIKASAGGGGKGMRLVTAMDQVADALTAAKREAKSSFGDDTIFLEKYIEPARHIEVQIFMDQQGNGVYLFDRDCSLQRRHQKIIEEADAPNLPAKVREQMGNTAVLAAKAIQYVGAGTIEFLVDDKANFYFMEMNTRLQVEHPVTEMITGLDLVEWQLQVAAGKPLPLPQSQLQKQGHAFEARIYAENPQNNFSPSIGKLVYFSMPAENKQVRIDTGVRCGDQISPYYDPLIAKLIVWNKDRESALTLLKTSLAATFIVGVDTNVTFLSQLCDNNDFQKAKIHTGFVEQHANDWQVSEKQITDELLAFIALAKLAEENRIAQTYRKKSSDQHSPWFLRDHWHLLDKSSQQIRFWYQDQLNQLTIKQINSDYELVISNKTLTFQAQIEKHTLTITINQHSYCAHLFSHEHTLHLFYSGNHYFIHWQNPKKIGTDAQASENRFIAPMPGTIVEILVKPGQQVKKGDRLLTLEAMKMEHTILAPTDGSIKNIHCQVGDLINEGVELLEFIAL